MKNVTASEICDELVNNFKLKEQVGNIQINLGDITANYNGKDAIGDLLQEWLAQWLKYKKYYFRTKTNTQEFPDFLLSESDTSCFLELKTFNAQASPAFDIANFDSYCTSLLIMPQRLDADYLILSYKMDNTILSIDNIWLKKVWELSSPSGTNPIKLQVKRGQIYNIRPCTWYSSRLVFKPFTNISDFLKAIAKTQTQYVQCDKYKTKWLQNIKSKYLDNTGVKIK